MSIKIRPHHLFCLLTYQGEGYSSDFIENFDILTKKIHQGEPIIFVEGPDDICAPIVKEEKTHCLEKSTYKRDKLATQYAKEHLLIETTPNSVFQFTNKILQNIRKNFSQNKQRIFCQHCEWETMCNNIARNEFRCAKIQKIVPPSLPLP